MAERYYSNDQLARHAARRPAQYLAELEACVARRDSGGAWVETGSPAFRDLWRKYAPARAPTLTPALAATAAAPRAAATSFNAGRERIMARRPVQRFTVCTFSTNDFAELADLTAAHNKAWADRHGYGFMNAVGSYAPNCPASWSRVPWYIALCDVLPAGSIVFHIDADAVVTNPDFRLESIAGETDLAPDDPNGFDLLFPIDHVGRHCGVCMWRVCPAVKTLFAATYERRHTEATRDYWEQGSLVREIESGRHAGVRERFVAKYALNCWLNWHTADWEPGSNVYHHVGETLPLKLAGVKRVLAAAKSGEQLTPFADPTPWAHSKHRPMRGAGDVVERVLDATGVSAVVNGVAKRLTGKPCVGCQERQAALNNLIPFKSRP